MDEFDICDKALTGLDSLCRILVYIEIVYLQSVRDFSLTDMPLLAHLGNVDTDEIVSS